MTEALSKDVEALHNTLLLGDVDALEKMIIKTAAHQASPSQLVNEIDSQGFAALHRVVRKPEQLPLLRALLKVPGIDVDVVGDDKETAFYMAVHNNNQPAADALVKAGAKVNVLCGLTPSQAQTPLHAAVRYGYDEMCAFLVHHKAELNARDGTRATPLIVAARMNRPSLVYQLLSLGAAPNLVEMDGKDALYAASELRHMHCVALLKADRKQLNEIWSHVRTDIKLEKPPLHSSEQLLAMAEARKAAEEEQEKALEELKSKDPSAAAAAAAAAAADDSKKKVVDDKKAAPKDNNKIPAPPASASTSKKQPQKQLGAAAAAAQDEKSRGNAAAGRASAPAAAPAQQAPKHVEPMATRTHDPLTGKKLPPCKTLEEVGPDSPQDPVPPHLRKQLPENLAGATQMVVGTGVPGVERPKAQPGLFINSVNTEESIYTS